MLGGPTIGGAGFNLTFAFANTSPTALNAGVIQIDDTGGLLGAPTTQTITDVANGNEFVIPDVSFAAGDTVTLDTGTHVLTVDQGGTPVFTMDNIFLEAGATNGFVASGDIIQAVCYARGTMIRTPDGELPVEKLRPGKQVVTLVDGQEISQTVMWLGHRRIGLAGHPQPETVAPIRIQRDAFADGMPHRDLVVSPDHAIFVDGKLICARQLVNGTTIRQETGWTAVDYYHVELDRHAILIAEGLLAESYIDTGNRGFFANSGVPMVLHPDLTDEFETIQHARQARACRSSGTRRACGRCGSGWPSGQPPSAGRCRSPPQQRMPACGFSPRAAASSRPTATAIWSSSPCHVAPARCGWSHAPRRRPTRARGWRTVAGSAFASRASCCVVRTRCARFQSIIPIWSAVGGPLSMTGGP